MDSDVPLIDLTIQHGRTQEEARRRLESAVDEITARFGAVLRPAEWTPDRNRVRLGGAAAWVEMWVDAQAVHLTADAPLLGRLFAGPLTRLKQIVEHSFQKRLP
jgi:hypothetical protein